MMYLLIELDEGKCGELQSRLREKRSQHLFLCVYCVELSKEGFIYEKKKDQLEEAFLQTVGGNYDRQHFHSYISILKIVLSGYQ